MKITKKIILLCIFSITLLSTFLFPRAYAQEWTYDGVDTEQIPDFSVFPSECYLYAIEGLGIPPNMLILTEVTHGNITNYGMMGNGTCVWGNGGWWNTTSEEKTLDFTDILLSYWNETVGYFSTTPYIIPVGNDGKVSPTILGSVFSWIEMSIDPMENSSIYEGIYSIAFWNEIQNNDYVHFNWTDDGILKRIEFTTPLVANYSLYSQPAQLPPVFSFTTEHDTLIVDSTDTDLKVAITDADNNNNGVIDTDYLYRLFYGSTWTTWAAIPTLIDFDLGSVPAGNYSVTIEVKNMYGITQEQIEIQYEPSEDGETPKIPGYSIILISIALLIGVSFVIHKNRKKI